MHKKLYLSILLIIVILTSILAVPVSANVSPQETLPPDQIVIPTPTETPIPTPKPAVGASEPLTDGGIGGVDGPINSEAGSDTVSGSTGTTNTTIVSGTITRIYKLKFNENNMAESLVKALLMMSVEGGYGMTDLLNSIYSGVFGLSNDSAIQDLRSRTWTVVASIAAMLAGLSLLLIITNAMTHGATSFKGFADVRTAIINWLVSLGMAGSSLFIFEKALQLSDNVGSAILSEMGIMATGELFSLNHFWGSLITGAAADIALKAAILLLPLGILAPLLFGALFNLFLIIAVFISVVMATASRTAIVFLAISLSPIIFVISTFEPLNWLKATWIKMLTIALLLGPINSVLIGLICNFQLKTTSLSVEWITGNMLAGVPSALMMLGFASLLITINFSVGKMVYGSALEIGSGVMSTMGSIANVALGAASFAASSGMIGGGNVNTPSTETTPAATPSLSSGQNAVNFGGNMGNSLGGTSSRDRSSELASRLGGIMARSGMPGMQGMGAGLQAGSAVADFRRSGNSLGSGGGGSLSPSPRPTAAPATPQASAPQSSGQSAGLTPASSGAESGPSGDPWSAFTGGQAGVESALFGNHGQVMPGEQGYKGGILTDPKTMRMAALNGVDLPQMGRESLPKIAGVVNSGGFSPAQIGRGLGFSASDDTQYANYTMASLTHASIMGGRGAGIRPPLLSGATQGINTPHVSAGDFGAGLYLAAEKSNSLRVGGFSPDAAKDFGNVFHYARTAGNMNPTDIYQSYSSAIGPSEWLRDTVNKIGADGFYNHPEYGYNGQVVDFMEKYNGFSTIGK